MKQYVLLIILYALHISCFSQESLKINGVNLVSPPSPVTQQAVATVKRIHANWVSIIPYAFSKGHTPKVHFNTDFQWWGEKQEGVIELIKQASAEKLHVMLKPHIWVEGDGWAGDFTLKNETDWLLWEQSFSDYILAYAKIAETYHVPLFCIGTEYRQAVKKRPLFWLQLIRKVRSIYKGKLTYAANWDNYENILFWDKLDYIGIDNYFSLSDKKTPNIKELKTAWTPIKKALYKLSTWYNRPILFTEYGYKSCNRSASGHWNTDNSKDPNELAQQNAYKALYETFWDEPWVQGGFLWKWHLMDRTKRNSNTDFTPQGKSAESIINDYYLK